MGILISQAAITNAIAAIRNSSLPGTVSIQHATAAANIPGMIYVETGRDLVALLRRNGWPEGREMRAQWSPSPAATTAVMDDVRMAMSQGAGSRNPLGAQAFTVRNSPIFGEAPASHTAAHEATHVVQQRGGNSNN